MATAAAPTRDVAREIRRARAKARRERQSLGDALYVLYVTALVLLYAVAALGSRSAPAPGVVRSAAAGAEPLLLLAVAFAVVVGRAAAAVRGGPVVLPPEDARLLLTWPVPRRALVVPALLAALSRALAAALVATVVLLYVDIRDLGAPAAAVWFDDLVLPALLAVLATLVAWLVQGLPRLAALVRGTAVLTGLAGLAAAAWLGRSLADRGAVTTLQRMAAAGPMPGSLPLGGPAAHSAPAAGPLVALALLALAVPLALLSLRAASRATPEQLLARSRRADVTRTALRLGFTSSVYLTRTEPVRRSRRRRYALRSGTPRAAMVAKAAQQEQGAPLLPRLLACATVSAAVLGAAARVSPGQRPAAPLAWSVVAAIALTAVATRFADPVRLDVDRAPFAAATPLPHQLLARTDLTISAVVATAGALIGVAADLALGIVGVSRLGGLVPAAIAVGVLLSAAGALGALSDDPSPFLPPFAQVGYRTSGFVAAVLACGGAAFMLRLPAAAGAAAPDRLPAAGLIVLAVALIAGAVTAHRAAGALTRGR